MFDVYGNFDSAEEINQKAEELFNKGDLDGIRVLAKENGIMSSETNAYLSGETEQLCDEFGAAGGKLELEEQEIVMVGVMEDWLGYIETLCFDDSTMARAVRRKDKSLKGCFAELLLWSLQNQKPVDKGVLAEAKTIISKRNIDLKKYGIEPRWLDRTTIGIPNMGTARKLIKKYYLED